MSRPLLLDLFSGAGGASEGYRRAGFAVIGVDINPQPRYPFPFIQGDALTVLDLLLDGSSIYQADGSAGVSLGLSEVAAIHASPPCQRWSVMSRCQPGLAERYPDLITPIRERLIRAGLPYIIENVPEAPLEGPVTLCASQFGLSTWWPAHGTVGLRRHRGLETSFPVPEPDQPCDHTLYVVPVCGHGSGGSNRLKGNGCSRAAREVMQINWMNRDELAEAIPPVYAEYVGNHLMDHLEKQRCLAS